MKKSAFTLIELLVVISIIAILASLAVPALNKSLENGRAASCAANVRQLATGAIGFLNDNDDQMFPAAGSWPTTLHDKYVRDWRAYRSPFDKRPASEQANAPVSYGVNLNLLDQLAAKFGSPSQLIMLAAAPNQAGDLRFDGNGAGNPTVSSTGDAQSGTHNNRRMINVAFADGHASAMSMVQYTDSGGLEGQRRWFPEGVTP